MRHARRVGASARRGVDQGHGSTRSDEGSLIYRDHVPSADALPVERILWMPGNFGGFPVDSEVKTIAARAAQAFEEVGGKVARIRHQPGRAIRDVLDAPVRQRLRGFRQPVRCVR